LVLSDIKGSTKAIQSGRYRQVNLIGAATIAAFMNVAETNDLPFVFGGDGATLLVPNSMVETLMESLRNLQVLAHRDFQLELRIGAVSMASLMARNQILKVAKYQLSPGNFLAQFKGGALTYAEELLKSHNPEMKMLSPVASVRAQVPSSLEGLSCRLKPLRASNGKILSLVCKPLATQQDTITTLNQVIIGLQTILKADFSATSPVKSKSLSWAIPPDGVEDEAKLAQAGPYWWRLFRATFWALVSNMSLTYQFRMGAFDPKKYRAELLLNSDIKKFDETLRMVLDCNPQQIEAIDQFLSDLQRQGLIAFGQHVSEQALMTCLVKSPVRNQHVHFIDGADGGYAMAALQLKQQLSVLERAG
jgi:hypothetical protein